MEHVLIKDLRFFDYPSETIFFREELDKARMELLNYVTRLFRGKRFVFINLFGDSVDPFLAEKFIKEFIPPESIVLDEIVEYLNVPVKRDFSVSFPDFPPHLSAKNVNVFCTMAKILSASIFHVSK